MWPFTFCEDLVERFTPSSHWFEPLGLLVHDAPEGMCWAIDHSREVRRDFRHLVDRRPPPAGCEPELFAFCSFSGVNVDHVDVVQPTKPTLTWLPWTDACDWEPGDYRLTVRWKLDLGIGGKVEAIKSNVFTVTPAE